MRVEWCLLCVVCCVSFVVLCFVDVFGCSVFDGWCLCVFLFVLFSFFSFLFFFVVVVLARSRLFVACCLLVGLGCVLFVVPRVWCVVFVWSCLLCVLVVRCFVLVECCVFDCCLLFVDLFVVCLVCCV